MQAAMAWGMGLASVAVIVLGHHAVLRLLACHVVPRLDRPRPWAVAGILMALFAAHVLQAQGYGLMLMVAAEDLGLGALKGATTGEVSDYLYFSLVNYTSLGLGDLRPTEELRLLAGLETLVGLLMIGWSTSFLFANVERLGTEED